MSGRVATPGQTIGPFFHYALPFPGDRELVPVGAPGAVRLHGYVYDGAGVGLPDALVEIQQTDGAGAASLRAGSMRRDGGFTGWGRSHTDPTGHYWFSTVEPGRTGQGPAFVAVVVFARGLLNRLFTRIYLPCQADAMQRDGFLGSLDPDDRRRLTADREADGSLRFDIHLQGPQETPFLSFPGHRARP